MYSAITLGSIKMTTIENRKVKALGTYFLLLFMKHINDNYGAKKIKALGSIKMTAIMSTRYEYINNYSEFS